MTSAIAFWTSRSSVCISFCSTVAAFDQADYSTTDVGDGTDNVAAENRDILQRISLICGHGDRISTKEGLLPAREYPSQP